VAAKRASASAKATAAKPSASARATADKKPETAKRLTVTQIRSGIGFDRKQTLALRGLGLRRLHHTVEVLDTPSSRGLILKVRHLVTVNE
jgi:large subunit ribosomal protein L30